MAGNDDLTMLIVGDVFVNRDDPPSIFHDVGDLLRSADFTLGNLEGPVADSGAAGGPKGAPHLINFRATARQIAAVQAAGFDAMSVANNHSLDFGVDALLETLDNLKRIGVGHAGGGRTKAEARAPAIVERQGCRVALLAYTSVFMPGWEAKEDRPGLAVIRAHTAYEPSVRYAEQPGSPPVVRSWGRADDKAQLGADIEAARQQADLVVCSFHWGVSERYTKLAEYQMDVGRHAVDAGADLVFGHHPHLLQGIEVYRGKPIFYSLGNFVFDMHWSEFFDLEAIIARCRIRDRRIAEVEYLPARSDAQLDAHVLDLDAGRDVLRMIEERSKPFGTRFTPAGDAVRILLD